MRSGTARLYIENMGGWELHAVYEDVAWELGCVSLDWKYGILG